MWGTSNWNQPGQQQPNQWPMLMQSDDLAVRAAEWAKQRLAMENQSQQQSMQGVPLQQHFVTGGTSSQIPPPTVPTSLGSSTDVFPPPLMGQPYPGSFTSQQPPGPSPPFGGGGKHEDKMDLDSTRGDASTVPPPLMGQQLMQGVHGLPQPDVAQYAPPQPPTPANPPPTQSYINEPSGTHYAPSVGQSSASFQPLPTLGGSYQPQVESKPPLLATPPNTGYNPQTQVFAPESLYMQQGGQPFHQEQAYPGQGFISESILHPASDLKKKTLPAWVKEGLVKMYREKQKEEEKEAKLREMELTKTQGGGPRWSVDDDSDSGGEGDKPAQEPPEEEMSDLDGSAQPRGILKKSVVSEATGPDSQHPEEEEEESDGDSNVSYEGQTALSEEELLQKVRKMTIELLLEVTGDEIADVASEVLQEMRGSRTNEKPTSSVHTRTLLGIRAYESDSSRSSGDDDGGSDDDDKNNQSLKLKKKALTNPYSNLPVPRDVDGSLRNDTIQKAFNPDEQDGPNSNETSVPRGRTQDESGAKLLPQTHPQILHQAALQRDPNASVAGETKSNKFPPRRESSGDSGSSSSSSEAGRSRKGHRRGRVGRKRSRTRSNSRGERSTSRDRRSLSKEQERRGSLSHAKDRKRQSRSRSRDRKRQSRSGSRDRKKRFRSRSRDRKRRSRSTSKGRKKRSRSRSKDRKRRSRSRSKDRKRRSRSRSKDRKRRSRSRSKDRKRRSRSRSKDRKRRSRSRSKDRKRRSRSRSKDRKRRSRSRSKDRKRRSRSRSKDRKRQSRSRSRDRQKRSLSRSKDRRRQSRSRSKDRWKRSRSRSMDRYRRSRSRSKDRHRRSQSPSRDGGRRSRSTSKDRRRRSQSRSKDRGKRSRSKSTDRQKHSPSWLKGTRSSRSRDTRREPHSKPSAEYMSSRRDQQLSSPSGSLSKSLAPSSVKGERDKASSDSKLGKHRHISSSSGSESEALRSSSSSSSSSTSSSESSDNSSSGSIKKKKSKKEHISKKSKATKSTKKGSTRKKRSPSLDTSRSSSRVSGRKKVEHSPPLRDRTHGRDKNGSEPRSASRKKKH